MSFVLFGIERGKILDEIENKLNVDSWECSTIEQTGVPGKLVLTARRHDYRLTEEQFKNDMLYFIRLSNMYEIGYDGWYASSANN